MDITISKVQFQYFINIIILFLVETILNYTKIVSLNFENIIHIIIQTLFIYGLISVLNKRKIIKMLFSFIISMTLLSILTYSAFPSAGILMSVIKGTSGEYLSFINQFSIQIILSISIFFLLAFRDFDIDSKFEKIFVILGLIYVLLPTAYFLLSKQKYPIFSLHSSYARGMSKFGAKLEYLWSVHMVNRFPLFKTIKGLNDSVYYLMKTNSGKNSTWTNVQYVKKNQETLIIVLGESMRADHLSLYGYERKTTPVLDTMKGIYFYKNVYSGGTNTWTSVPAMFTQFKDMPILSKSIIHLAKDAGFSTYWLSNQTLTSEWDYSVSSLAKQSDYSFFTANEKYTELEYDGVLIPKLENILKMKESRNNLIVLNFYGSHMAFKDRYPQKFNLFRKPNYKSRIEKRIDQYDNSIYYTDFLLGKIFEIGQKYSAKVIYFSDHGLGNSKSKVPLVHDVRENPDVDSIKVPFISNEPLNLSKYKPVNLFYFECIFSNWSGITADDLNENVCKRKLSSGDIIFYDSNLKLHRDSYIAH